MLNAERIDSNRIMQLLPHSYPFLLVDQVEKYSQHTIECRKNISANEPYFQGHFKGNPIVPGVLLIECAAQSAALMYILDAMKYEELAFSTFDSLCAEGHLSEMVGYIAAVKDFKFQKIVKPGDVLFVTCHKTHEVGLLSEVTVSICDEKRQLVCKGRILVSKNESGS